MSKKVQDMTPDEIEEFGFWSDYSRSLTDGEIPMADGWPKEFPMRLGKATEYAAEKFHWKARKGTFIPYMSHLLAVTSLVYEMGGKSEQVIAALLHDVVEDTDTTLDEVERLFGSEVREIVLNCSNAVSDGEKNDPWHTRKARSLVKMSTEPMDSLIVSLADKLHNARCIVRDLKISGVEVWSRFSAKPVKVAAYYDAIGKVFLERCDEGGDVFRFYVEEFCSHVEAIRRGAMERE